MNALLSRRGFLRKGMEVPLAAAVTAAMAGISTQRIQHTEASTAVPPARPNVCLFSKHLQFLNYDDLADTCVELGLEGIDLTVRPGGHVTPEHLDKDLERAVRTIRDAGLEVPMITTRLTEANDEADTILSAAAELGISCLRIGGHRYNDDESVGMQIERITESLLALTELAGKYQVKLGYHNHSGYGYFGGPVWDLLHVYRSIGLPNIGSNLDLGHVTVEGAYGAGMVIVRLLAEMNRVHMVALKDFVWEESRPRWLPLGEGYVPTLEYLKVLQKHGFSGPVSLHFEYNTGSESELLEEIRNAVVLLKVWLTEAGYAT